MVPEEKPEKKPRSATFNAKLMAHLETISAGQQVLMEQNESLQARVEALESKKPSDQASGYKPLPFQVHPRITPQAKDVVERLWKSAEGEELETPWGKSKVTMITGAFTNRNTNQREEYVEKTADFGIVRLVGHLGAKSTSARLEVNMFHGPTDRYIAPLRFVKTRTGNIMAFYETDEESQKEERRKALAAIRAQAVQFQG